MTIADLSDWTSSAQRRGCVWYVKRLSANDTLANESHQAGPYVPKDLLFELYPALGDRSRPNPNLTLPVRIDSHGVERAVRVIWYNNKFFGGTRDEARITGWGGRESPVLNPDATGALVVFCFERGPSDTDRRLRIWLCRNTAEEDRVEELVGPVEPGRHVLWKADGADVSKPMQMRIADSHCYLAPEQLPSEWQQTFPPALKVVQKVLELRPLAGATPDDRLLKRRDCEYELFRCIEDLVEGPVIRHGFGSVADFLTHAQRILQRRKARSGKSLELQVRAIFLEEGMREGVNFSHNSESEPGKSPDFLFPSESAYKDPAYPVDKLKMLAVKTTCRDRWRQILNEADRIREKHLLTLQEGVSPAQHAEMVMAGVTLVVPHKLLESYPASIRPRLLTFGKFISSAHLL